MAVAATVSSFLHLYQLTRQSRHCQCYDLAQFLTSQLDQVSGAGQTIDTSSSRFTLQLLDSSSARRRTHWFGNRLVGVLVWAVDVDVRVNNHSGTRLPFRPSSSLPAHELRLSCPAGTRTQSTDSTVFEGTYLRIAGVQDFAGFKLRCIKLVTLIRQVDYLTYSLCLV